MSDEPSSNGGRVTVTHLYEALNEFRRDMTDQFDKLRLEMRGSYPTIGVCDERHKQVEKLSKDVDDLRRKVYIGVGIAAALSFLVPLVLRYI